MHAMTRFSNSLGLALGVLLLLTVACDGGSAPAPDPLPVSVYTRGEIRDFTLAADTEARFAVEVFDAAVLTRNLGGPCWEVLIVDGAQRDAFYIDEAGEQGPYVVARLHGFVGRGGDYPITSTAFDQRMAEWLAPTPSPTPRPSPTPTATPTPVPPTFTEDDPGTVAEWIDQLRRRAGLPSGTPIPRPLPTPAPTPRPESLRCLEIAASDPQ